MEIRLRDYQKRCLRAILRNSEKGVMRPLVCLPTGTGKTVVFAYLIKMLKGRSLILVHRDELLTQAEEKLLTVWPKAKVGIVKAKRNELVNPVTIASVQTLSRKTRLKQVENVGYDLIVTDEAHHAVADSYRRIYDCLLKDDRDDQIHLGVTATPNRTDRIGLGKVYQKVVYSKSLLDMIQAGWLSDLRGVTVRTSVQLGDVHTRAGDFATGELASVVNTSNRNELIVEAHEKHAKGRLTLAFTVDVQHAHDLAQAFQDKGYKAVALSGKTPLEERRATLRKFHKREVDIICNCQLLTEGFDEPAIDCIVLARPTKSNTLYIQMIGRGTRAFPNKKDCIVLDVADNAGKHHVAQLPDLVGLKREYKLEGEQTLMQLVGMERQEQSSMLYGRGISSEQVDLFMGSELVWISADERYILNLGDQGRIYISPTKRNPAKYAVIHRPKAGDSTFLSPRPVPLSWALGIGDAAALKIAGEQTVLMRKDAEWRSRPMSGNQMRILDENKIKYNPMVMTRGEASDKISQVFAKGGGKKKFQGVVKQSQKQDEYSGDLVEMMRR